MFLCVDVHYTVSGAVAAGVVFRHIMSPVIHREYITRIEHVHRYVPGQFYKRELPAILALIREVREKIQTIIIDGYVWLSADSQPGMGAHLHKELGGRIPVIGVAKSAYHDSSTAVRIYRGRSRKPLYVTCAGMPEKEAAQLIEKMHGAFRLPTLLKYVDNLARTPFVSH